MGCAARGRALAPHRRGSAVLGPCPLGVRRRGCLGVAPVVNQPVNWWRPAAVANAAELRAFASAGPAIIASRDDWRQSKTPHSGRRVRPGGRTRCSLPLPPGARSIADWRWVISRRLLVERFGAQHPQAVATIVTTARQPVRLDALIDQYEDIGEGLRSAGPDESWWTGVKRELGTLVTVHRADVPSVRPQARFDRAEERLRRGEVDGALAETMRLPGVARASDWIAQARRYVAVHRALDEIESPLRFFPLSPLRPPPSGPTARGRRAPG